MTVNSTDPVIQQIEAIDKQDIPIQNISDYNGLNVDYANSNKWVGYIPIQNVLGKSWKNLELNLTRFTIPQMEMGSTEVSFKGYSYQFPTKVMDSGDKQITFEYIIDAHWYNYKALYAWMSGLEGNINPIYESDNQGPSIKDVIDIRVWLIDHFKNRILDLCFRNCWIKTFMDLSLESNNPEEVHHSVVFQYSNYELLDVSQPENPVNK